MGKYYYRLMLITNKKDTPINDYLYFIKNCAKAGITSVQLREKKLNYDQLLYFGKKLKTTLNELSIPLIINDNLALAIELNAEGVHLGQSDGNIIEARNKLGKNKIIGLSISNLDQLHIANTLPINYIGVGSIFPTKSKKNIENILYCDGLKQISNNSTHHVIAIGGININNANKVINSGASGIAAIEVFHNSFNYTNTIKVLLNIVKGANHAKNT